jgi:uncharacterized OB-fold protein
MLSEPSTPPTPPAAPERQWTEPFARMAPPLTERTRAYWTGGADGQLLIARCESCATYVHPPRPICSRCASPSVTPTAVSGRGTVHAYTVSAYQWVATMPPPYVVAQVELVEQPGLLVLSNIVGVDPAEVRVDLPVEVRFVPTGDAHVPVFVPSGSGTGTGT